MASVSKHSRHNGATHHPSTHIDSNAADLLNDGKKLANKIYKKGLNKADWAEESVKEVSNKLGKKSKRQSYRFSFNCGWHRIPYFCFIKKIMNFAEDIEGLVSNKLEIFKTIFAIVKLETRLVGLSIVPLILNITMILVAVITIWSSLMLIVGYSLMHWFSSFIVSVFGIMSVNVFITFGLFKYLSFNLKSMSFEKTRAYFNRRETQDVHIAPTPTCKAESTRKKTSRTSAKRKPV